MNILTENKRNTILIVLFAVNVIGMVVFLIYYFHMQSTLSMGRYEPIAEQELVELISNITSSATSDSSGLVEFVTSNERLLAKFISISKNTALLGTLFTFFNAILIFTMWVLKSRA